MVWLEVSVKTDGEGAEAVAEALKPYAHNGGVVLEQFGDEKDPDPSALQRAITVKIYISEVDDSVMLRRRIEERLYHMARLYPLPAPSYRKIQEEDWANAWKANYRPFRVGDKLWIRPSWLDASAADLKGGFAEEGDIVLLMDPGMAFGTGTHPTTRLCLALVEEWLEQGAKVLDVGTGSAILAIAAAKLGASRVLGVDLDAQAIKAARSNVTINGTEMQVEIRHGGLESVHERAWDIVVVNILADVIRDLLRKNGVVNYLAADGKLILSGILEQQLDEVKAAVVAGGGIPIRELSMSDWTALLVEPAPNLGSAAS